MYKCIIDIGSNTIKLFIAKLANDIVIPLCVKRRMTLLAKGMTVSNNLSIESKHLVIENLEEYLKICENYGIKSSDLLVTATAAIRNAQNAEEFIDELKRQFNLIHIQVLSGEEEAKFAFLGAVLSVKDFDHDWYYVLDVGGGSLQLAYGTSKDYCNGISIQKGCNYATEIFGLDSKINEDKLFKVINYYKNIEINSFVTNKTKFCLLGIGGSIKIVQHMTKLVANDSTITLSELLRIAYSLSNMSVLERYEWFCEKYPDEVYRKDAGLTQDRARVILAGVCILIGIVNKLETQQITVASTDAKDYLITTI